MKKLKKVCALKCENNAFLIKTIKLKNCIFLINILFLLIWFKGKSRISRFPKKVLKHQILAIVNVKIVEIIIRS